MRRVARSLFVLFVVAALLSLAFAKYRPEYDVYITVDVEQLEALAAELGISQIGSNLFDAQEAAHAAATAATGVEVDHYYIWFCAGDQCIPVDPFTASN